MHPALQAKLLHVLQDHEFSRLGGKRDIQVDVRVLSATNKPLERAVEEGVFREDLFYRLNVVTIHIPPLRERREEIPVFLKYFLEKYCEHYGKKPSMFSEYAVTRMMEYAWPGNIRELENLVKRYVIVGNEAQIIRELSTHKPIVTSFGGSVSSLPGSALAVPSVPPVQAAAHQRLPRRHDRRRVRGSRRRLRPPRPPARPLMPLSHAGRRHAVRPGHGLPGHVPRSPRRQDVPMHCACRRIRLLHGCRRPRHSSRSLHRLKIPIPAAARSCRGRPTGRCAREAQTRRAATVSRTHLVASRAFGVATTPG